ncbi:MAG TPA: prolyl oligopeptidase family serine peptidase [Terracidiphilus sp.]|jgi:prolyl oligopeptidase
MQKVTQPYPLSKSESLTETLHGVSVADPYRWLEDRNSAQTTQWLEEQRAFTRRYLDSLPGRERIRSRIRELLSSDFLDTPHKVGERIFFLKRSRYSEQPAIMMRESLDGPDITLLDPTSHFGLTSLSVGIIGVSSDARLLAFTVREGGEDLHAIQIFSVDEGRIIVDSLPRGTSNGFVLSDDSTGFFYSHDVSQTNRLPTSAYWHAFGTNSSEDFEVFAAPRDKNVRLSLVGSPACAYVGFLVTRMEETRVHEFYVQDKRGRLPARLFLHGIEGRLIPRISGKSLACLILSGCDNGQIICTDLQSGVGAWQTVVPPSRAKIHDFALVRKTIFVRYVQNAETRVEMFGLMGQRIGQLPAPSDGTTRLFPCDPEGDSLFYRFSSFVEPPAIYCYHPQTKANRLWTSQQFPFDRSSFVVTQAHCNSTDGTRIPVHLVRQKQWAHLHSLPTLLTAYGGFGNSITPEFSLFGSLMMEKGCLFAVASVRGGAEFGEQWHQAAKRHNRQNAITDFLEVSQWLLRERHTSPQRLAIAGGSNGGLLVAAATTQSPGLFRATLCLGPLFDMLRYHLFDSARNYIEEFGSADDSNDFPYLLAYSPYHRVKDHTAYPAIMIVSGDSDSRCNPMHARKMTARLQAASVSRRPILLDYRPECGHRPVQPLQTRVELLTNRISFLCRELDISA